jgi:sugar-specific transcriptional regulator TrmB
VRYGELSASDIAAHIDSRQEKVYQPLRQLESQGYVLIQEENPQIYKAQNPRFVIEQEREEFRSDTDGILQDLEEAWEMAEEGLTRVDDHAWLLSGKNGMNTEQSNLFSEADESVIGFDSQFHLRPPYSLENIEEQSRSGVQICLVGHENATDGLNRLSASDIDTYIISKSDISKPSFYVADGKRVLLNVSDGRATVVFDDREFATIMTEEFESILNRAEPI